MYEEYTENETDYTMFNNVLLPTFGMIQIEIQIFL